MEQEQVVDGAMLDFNTKFPLVEEELKIHVRYLFNLVWMTGWENRATEWGKGNMCHSIQQLDRFGNVLRTFPSLIDASKELDYSYNSLKKALSRGSITHNGRFRWRHTKVDNLTSSQSGSNGKPLPDKNTSHVLKKSSSAHKP